MRIAVCDDLAQDLTVLCSLLTAYDASLTPECYDAAEPLLGRANCYDAVFLDIEMQAPNGYEVARRLAQQTPHPLIIFVTHTPAYAVQGYGIAFRYLLKPVSLAALAEVMEALDRELRAYRITVLAEGTSYVLDVREILYAEVLNHTAVLHTTEGTYTFRAALRDLEQQLPARVFCAPHQSYLVNLQHVRAADSQFVILTNGEHIPISRRRRQAILHQLHTWLGGAP